MAYSAPFQPVILFQPETPADKLAVDMVYSLQNDIRETMNTERSQQTTIGLSEIGMECDRCVARMLSGQYANIDDGDKGWKAQIGTFGHAGLEQHFGEKYGNKVHWLKSDFDDNRFPVPTDEKPHYHLEADLKLWQYKTLDLGGHCDLYIEGETFGIVDDWKFQGPTKLKQTSAGKIGQQYTVQMSAYGLAWQQLGKLVTHVCLYALPRDGDLNEARPVLMRFDPKPAVDALARLQRMIDAAEILEAGFPGEGWDRLIRAQARAGHCFSCAAYEAQEDRGFFGAMFN